MSPKNLKFLKPVILGQKTSVYQLLTVNQNGAILGTFYTFENADGRFAFFS